MEQATRKKPIDDYTNDAPKRSIFDIRQDLQKHLPPRLIKRKQNGIDYIEWHTAAKILTHYTNGLWKDEVLQTTVLHDQVLVVVKITIVAAEGEFFHDNVGSEFLTEVNKQGEVVPIRYGDPWTNAYAQAFKRAAAMFGVAQHLYEKD